ncbi:putative ribonuclease H-like domain-containing protein [Tanacetum coccineum]
MTSTNSSTAILPVEDGLNNENAEQERFADDSSTKYVNAVEQQVNTASPDVNTGSLKLNAVGPSVSTASPNEEDSTEEEHKIHKDHPIDNVIGEVQLTVQTRRMSKPTSEQGFLSDVYEQKTHDTLNTYLYACFLSQIEPTSIAKALSDSSWVEAMQEELLQEEGIDYEEVFALVARIEAIRLFLAYASFMGFLVYQMDVKSAFLYFTIEEEVYVTQPPGFKDPDHPDKVYKVVKALYGLHQTPKAWYETLANYLLSNGFKRGKIDQTLFIKKQKGDILLVHVYVDDIIFGSTNKELLQQKEDGIFISQDKYVAEILKKFNSDVKSMIGSLMYLTASRPDIMFEAFAYSRDSPLNWLISWQCKKQTMVATSITEDEYVATANCCGQVKHVEYLMLNASPFEVMFGTEDNGLGSQYDMGTKVATVSNSYLLKHCLRGGISKEVGTPRYLSLVVPLTKVSDEAVHKELGDRMERAATTASSLEGIGSGSGPRCQDTILRDVNAQTRFEITSKQSIDPPLSRGYTLRSGEDIMTLIGIDGIFPKFVETHNVVAFLEKPTESDGFAEIIDFLKASSVSYALTVNPIIYTSCIQQFWATAHVKMVNEVRQFQALIDKNKVIITKASIRNDIHLDDAEGTDCLPNTTIFEELAKMGYEKPSQKLTFYKAFFSPQWKFMIHTITQSLNAKSTAWNEFSSTMASLIICLATNIKFNLSKYIFDAMVKHLDEGVKFLLYPRFLQVFINQQLGDMSHHKKNFVNPFHTKKIFANMKREGKDFSRKVTPLLKKLHLCCRQF